MAIHVHTVQEAIGDSMDDAMAEDGDEAEVLLQNFCNMSTSLTQAVYPPVAHAGGGDSECGHGRAGSGHGADGSGRSRRCQ